MPTPSTTIGLSDVNTELRNTAGTKIGLGDADVRVLARVPSGNIGLDDLKNKSIVIDAGISPPLVGGQPGETAKTGVWWGSAGAFQTIVNDVFTNQQPGLKIWALKFITGLGNDYQLRVDTESGSDGILTSDFALNTWVSLGTDRRMDLQNQGPGFQQRTFNVKIRESSTPQTIVAEKTLTFAVEVVDGPGGGGGGFDPS